MHSTIRICFSLLGLVTCRGLILFVLIYLVPSYLICFWLDVWVVNKTKDGCFKKNNTPNGRRYVQNACFVNFLCQEEAIIWIVTSTATWSKVDSWGTLVSNSKQEADVSSTQTNHSDYDVRNIYTQLLDESRTCFSAQQSTHVSKSSNIKKSIFP